MTTNPGNNADPQGQTPNGTDPQGQTPTTPPQGQTPSGQKTSIDSLPSDIQDYIKTLRADAKKYRDASEAETKAKQSAEEQRLKEQGEFKQLAEKHEARVKELEPTAARFEALAAKIRKQIQTATKDWPAEIKAFYPGDDADIDQLQDWFDRSQPLLEKLQTQARATLPGNRPNPPAANRAGTQADADQRNRQAFVRQRSYGL